jgi:hypothetical protein
MTESAAAVKARISRVKNGIDSDSAWLTKQELSEKAFADLSRYIEENKFKMAFIVRGTDYLVPKRRWGQLPVGFERRRLDCPIKADQDFIYIQFKLSNHETEANLQKYIKLLYDTFKDLKKYLWINGVLKNDL